MSSSSAPDKNPILDPKRKSPLSWSDHFAGEKLDPNEALKHVILKMRLQSISNSGSTTPLSESEPDSADSLTPSPLCASAGYFSLLNDELLLNVLSRVSDRKQQFSNLLVRKRWCMLCGRLIQSIVLSDWEFLESGRLTFRFPNLVDISVVPACIKFEMNSGILLHARNLRVYLNSGDFETGGLFVRKEGILDTETIDKGMRILAEGCRNLRRIAVMNLSEEGLRCLGKECEMLQEMEIHCCSELALKGINDCQNLQIVKLIGRIDGVYDVGISDIGMTILAQGCRRLLKLELVGCEGSFDGIKAIGMCCQMLEELTLCDHRMEGGWLSALSFCSNLKILSIHSSLCIDENPVVVDHRLQQLHLGPCPMLEELHLRRCRLDSKEGVKSLFFVCQRIRGLMIEDCWGLDDSVFASATILRGIRRVSVEGCSLVTAQGLESVVLTWKELARLKVVSCNSIRDSEISPELATLFSVLKELKWRPNSKSNLSAGLSGTDVGQGGRSLRGK